jgi:ATP-dependent Clp protease protease subunit
MSQKFKAANSGDELTIYCYDDIGPEWLGLISAETIAPELDNFNGSKINVRINSPGGDVDQALAIYNALVRHGAVVHTHIDGMAASAASYVAMAGDTITIADNGLLMIHNAWISTSGNKEDLAKTITVLEKIDGILRSAYAGRSGQTQATIKSWMSAETWFTGSEAVAAGLADQVGTEFSARASIAPGRYKRTPSAAVDSTKARYGDRPRTVDEIKSIMEQFQIDCGLAQPRRSDSPQAWLRWLKLEKERLSV